MLIQNVFCITCDIKTWIHTYCVRLLTIKLCTHRHLYLAKYLVWVRFEPSRVNSSISQLHPFVTHTIRTFEFKLDTHIMICTTFLLILPSEWTIFYFASSLFFLPIFHFYRDVIFALYDISMFSDCSAVGNLKSYNLSSIFDYNVKVWLYTNVNRTLHE